MLKLKKRAQREMLKTMSREMVIWMCGQIYLDDE